MEDKLKALALLLELKKVYATDDRTTAYQRKETIDCDKKIDFLVLRILNTL